MLNVPWFTVNFIVTDNGLTGFWSDTMWLSFMHGAPMGVLGLARFCLLLTECKIYFILCKVFTGPSFSVGIYWSCTIFGRLVNNLFFIYTDMRRKWRKKMSGQNEGRWFSRIWQPYKTWKIIVKMLEIRLYQRLYIHFYTGLYNYSSVRLKQII